MAAAKCYHVRSAKDGGGAAGQWEIAVWTPPQSIPANATRVLKMGKDAKTVATCDGLVAAVGVARLMAKADGCRLYIHVENAAIKDEDIPSP